MPIMPVLESSCWKSTIWCSGPTSLWCWGGGFNLIRGVSDESKEVVNNSGLVGRFNDWWRAWSWLSYIGVGLGLLG